MNDTISALAASALSPQESKALVRAVNHALDAHGISRALGPMLAEALVGSWERSTSFLEHLGRSRVSDLSLAVGVLHGDATATRAIISLIDEAFADVAGDEAARLEDVRERLHERVLGDGTNSVLRSYRGLGGLRSWLRVTATRLILRQTARDEHRAQEAELEPLVGPENPELSYLKVLYRHEFRRAFTTALAGLNQRDRTLLRLVYLDRLPVERVASLYSVHRVTAARWLAQARRELGGAIRQQLSTQLELHSPSRSLIDGVLDVALSNPDISLNALVSGASVG